MNVIFSFQCNDNYFIPIVPFNVHYSQIITLIAKKPIVNEDNLVK